MNREDREDREEKKLAYLAAGQLDGVMHELGLRGLDVRAEYPIPIRYKEGILDRGYRADLLVDEGIPSIEPNGLPISS
jgi:hypothetical protein